MLTLRLPCMGRYECWELDSGHVFRCTSHVHLIQHTTHTLMCLRLTKVTPPVHIQTEDGN